MSLSIGEPTLSTQGNDVLAFHLHRYLRHWFDGTDAASVAVCVGHADSSVPCTCITVERETTSRTGDLGPFAELLDQYQKTGEVPRAVAVTEPMDDAPDEVIAFARVDAELDHDARQDLRAHLGEAIRAARRNSVRLWFDESDPSDMKAYLYDLMSHLPEWVGCDVAAAFVLADSLEAMTIEHAGNANFFVAAERLFAQDSSLTRLVGLAVDLRDDIRTTIDAAVELLAADSQHGPITFRRDGNHYVDPDGNEAVSIGVVEGRPHDAQSVVVPLVARWHGEEDLIGFMCLGFRRHAPLTRSARALLEQICDELGHVLRTSPLFSISSSRMRLLREIRAACEQRVRATGPATTRRDALVQDVVDIVRRNTEVPAFSIGYVLREPRRLRYVASFGWSAFESIDLPVDVAAADRADSGVSALAVRLQQPLALAGGAADGHEFKNFLWVHEESGRIVDARAPGVRPNVDDGWTELRAYYKPAREGAYATIAHPIDFAGETLGVVALEVDRDTDWTWWGAYGGRLLWELVASELAFALWSLPDG